MSVFKVSVTGCGLGDFVYNNVDFNSAKFKKYQSLRSGDGGLEPGKLVFTHEFERYAQKAFSSILTEIAGLRMYDAFNVGGPALVAAINAAQLLYDKPIQLNYYGALGNDDKGVVISGLLSLLPLKMDHYIQLEGETPYTDVLSDPNFAKGKGERIFINNIGCANDYDSSYLDAEFWSSQMIVFGATALVPKLHDELTDLLERAKSLGALTVVHTVYDFLNEKKNPKIPWPLGDTLKSLALIDLLIMDHEEALRISGESNIHDAHEFYKSNGLNAFIITHGAAPSYLYSSGKFFEPIDEILPVCEWINDEFAAKPHLKGDTTGCGDNFVGAVISSVASQMQSAAPSISLREAAIFGTASGGFACYYVGGTYFEKKKGEKLNKINQMLDNYKLNTSK